MNKYEQALRLAAKRDWLPYEAIPTMPVEIRMLAWQAGIASGRFSINQVRRGEGMRPTSIKGAAVLMSGDTV